MNDEKKKNHFILFLVSFFVSEKTLVGPLLTTCGWNTFGDSVSDPVPREDLEGTIPLFSVHVLVRLSVYSSHGAHLMSPNTVGLSLTPTPPPSLKSLLPHPSKETRLETSSLPSTGTLSRPLFPLPPRPSSLVSTIQFSVLIWSSRLPSYLRPTDLSFLGPSRPTSCSVLGLVVPRGSGTILCQYWTEVNIQIVKHLSWNLSHLLSRV